MPRLKDVVEGVDRIAVQGPLDVELDTLTHDSRHVRPGGLFFALPGHKTDGNRFLAQAFANGAVAVVSELACPPAPIATGRTWIQVKDAHQALGIVSARFYGRPTLGLKVVGVTGTNGKTTTTYFLESILEAAGRKVGVLGTVSYRLNGREVGKAVNTTPLASEVQRFMALARDEGATHIVMEVSSHALSLARVDEVAFDVAVFTNLSRDHLDFHKTKEAYFESKKKLFGLLGLHKDAKPERCAVINADDPWAPKLFGSAPGATELRYGIDAKSTIRATKLKFSVEGTAFDLLRGKTKTRVHLRLVGRHNVYNALAAAAAAFALGVSEAEVAAGLEKLHAVPGRLESVEAGQRFRVLVDYAHTDAALETVLAMLAELPHERILTVFGCGGDRDRTKRGPMGKAACAGSDRVFVTSDNPRSEDPERILGDIRAGLDEGGYKNFKVVPDRREAIAAAIGEAREGDVVLIAGKGHEDYQILRDKTIHFDDREVARECLQLTKRP